MNQTAPSPEWPLGPMLREGRGALSMRQAAERAGFSEGTWRNVERGVSRAGGVIVPSRPTAATVAAAARAVGVSVRAALTAAGHDPLHYPELVTSGHDSADAERAAFEAWFAAQPESVRADTLAALIEAHVSASVFTALARK